MSQSQATPLFAHAVKACVPVELRDGAVATLRPLDRGETAPLFTVFDGMSAGSRALRYLGPVRRLSGPMLTVLSGVDHDRHVAWVASVDGEAAGIARYVVVPSCATTAEVAFEVADRYHGQGLATALLDTITTVAAARGVRRIRATLAPSNKASRRLLERVGATCRLVDGLAEAEGPLRLVAPPAVDRSAVLGLALGGRAGQSLRAG